MFSRKNHGAAGKKPTPIFRLDKKSDIDPDNPALADMLDDYMNPDGLMLMHDYGVMLALLDKAYKLGLSEKSKQAVPRRRAETLPPFNYEDDLGFVPNRAIIDKVVSQLRADPDIVETISTAIMNDEDLADLLVGRILDMGGDVSDPLSEDEFDQFVDFVLEEFYHQVAPGVAFR